MTKITQPPARDYFDWNATAPCLPEVRERMADVLDCVGGNPSSLHAEGRAARRILEQARSEIARALGAEPDEIVFTSGGTEANHLALGLALDSAAAGGRHGVASAIEHASLIEPVRMRMERGEDVTLIGCLANGRVDPSECEAVLRPDTGWISVMLVNNETGVIQPVRELSELARRHGAIMHTDAVQALGRLPLDVNTLGIGAMSLSAHKIGGPPGIGLLYVRHGVALTTLAYGGRQESGRRPGTENVAAAAGFALAIELAVAHQAAEWKRLHRLQTRFETAVRTELDGVHINGDDADRVPHTSNLSFDNCRGDDLAAALDAAGMAVSVGSACHAGDRRPSHVLEAMCLTPGRCRGALRFSFGPATDAGAIDRLLATLPPIVRRLRTPGHETAAQTPGGQDA